MDFKKTCDICNRSSAKYTCPRCNKSYCGLACYQAPSHLTCSESFYQDQVINELKTCRIDDEGQQKMAEILKRDLERAEKDAFDLNDDSDVDESCEDKVDQNEEVSTDEMVKAYEKQATEWQPWWNDLHLIVEEIEKGLNQRLIDNASSINVCNANPLLYSDIIQTSYLYIILASVYQLDEEDFRSKSAEINEICSAFIEIEKIVTKVDSNKSGLDLKSKLNILVATLLQEENYFLKVYLNKQVLSNFLEDLIKFCKRPVVEKKFLSHLYDLCESNLNVKETSAIEREIEVEKPINVFYLNKNHSTKRENQSTNSRVQILSKSKKEERVDQNKPKNTSKTVLSTNKNATKKEIKMLMKKLEYYYKWLTANLCSIESSSNICEVIADLKDSIRKEIGEFEDRKQLIDSNLKLIRTKINAANNRLIEEL